MRWLFLFLAVTVSAQPLPPATTPWSRALLRQTNGVTTIGPGTDVTNILAQALSGSIIQLASGTFNITNSPWVIPSGVILQGTGTNSTILRNWIRGDGAIAGRGAGINPGNNCTIRNLCITNALNPTNYQACIGAISPQAVFTDLTTRDLVCSGSSDGYQVNQATAFNLAWNDYNSVVTTKWDVVVFLCNDSSSPSRLSFHSFGSLFKSVGPAASGANTAHGFLSQVDFIDVSLKEVTLDVTANSVNRAWEIQSGLEEGDTTGVFSLKDCNIVGNTVNAGSIVPTTNSTLISLISSSRDASNLTNVSGANVTGSLTNNTTGTSSAPITAQTNFLSGVWYTNLTGRSQTVQQTYAWTDAGVNGTVKTHFITGQQGAALGTWVTNDSIGQQTITTTLVVTNCGHLGGFVSNSIVWCFTNQVVGAGNSTVPIAGTGQLITY